MRCKTFLVLLVSAFVLAFAAQAVSAFGTIQEVQFDDVVVYPTSASVDLANFAGTSIPVEINFLATADALDVRIKAWISGERDTVAVSERFDVVANRTYKRTVLLQIPTDLNDRLDEVRALEIAVENREQTADEESIDFTVQRESYIIEILSVNLQSQVKSGESLVIDTVLKNIGRHTADDVFLKVSVPQLGLETTTYFGDLTPTDRSSPDKEDAVERRTFLRLPADTPAGLYTVELKASNSDSVTTMQRKILVDGAEEDTMFVASATSKTFSTGETGEYKITLVNRGSVVRVYEIEATSVSSDLNLDVSDPMVVVPAGSSKTISVLASAAQRDDYDFRVTVKSDQGNVLSEKNFVANVRDKGTTGTGAPISNNATVLLTIVLAIVFVVLLVVLIVLLTRKPEKSEEFGESYY